MAWHRSFGRVASPRMECVRSSDAHSITTTCVIRRLREMHDVSPKIPRVPGPGRGRARTDIDHVSVDPPRLGARVRARTRGDLVANGLCAGAGRSQGTQP